MDQEDKEASEKPAMENFQSLRAVMKQIETLNEMVVKRLEALAATRHKTKPRDGMVLEAVATERKVQCEAIAEYLRTGPKDILDTYFQYVPDVPLDKNLLTGLQGEDADSILEGLSRFDDVMCDVYEQLGRRAEVPALRNVLESFKTQLGEQQRRAAGASNDAYDL